MLRYLSKQQRDVIAPAPLKIKNILERVSGSNELNTSRRTGQSYFHVVLPHERKNEEPVIELAQVVADIEYSFVLSVDGILYRHIKNGTKQFIELELPEKIAKIHQVYDSTFLLSATGKVWASRSGREVIQWAQLEIPESVSSISTYFLNAQCLMYFLTITGKVFLWVESKWYPSSLWVPKRVDCPSTIVSIVSTSQHKLFLSDTGLVYDGGVMLKLPEPIVSIAASQQAVLMVSVSGKAYRPGNSVIEEVDGTVLTACVVKGCAALLMSDKSLYVASTENPAKLKFELVPSLKFSQISRAESCIMLLSDAGKLYSLGEGWGETLRDKLYLPKLVTFNGAITDVDASRGDDGIVIECEGEIYRTIAFVRQPSFCDQHYLYGYSSIAPGYKPIFTPRGYIPVPQGGNQYNTAAGYGALTLANTAVGYGALTADDIAAGYGSRYNTATGY